jgi:hypothetical protein
MQIPAIVSSRLLRSIMDMVLAPNVGGSVKWACAALSRALASPLARVAAAEHVPDLVSRLERVVASGPEAARLYAEAAIGLLVRPFAVPRGLQPLVPRPQDMCTLAPAHRNSVASRHSMAATGEKQRVEELERVEYMTSTYAAWSRVQPRA